MDLPAIAQATAKMLSSYFTYQAIRVIDEQLRESNPRLSRWFNHFSGQRSIHDGDAYLSELFTENPRLAMRVMTVRQHLAEQILDGLPEQVRADVGESNLAHQRRYIEASLHLPSSTDATDN